MSASAEHRSEQRSDDGVNLSSHSALSNMKQEMSILEELELKFGSAKNKSQIIHALEHSSILHRIPLPTPNATTEQARKDFRRERVLLNEVPFIPDKVDVDRCNAFSMTLKVLIERMSRAHDLYDAEMYPHAEAITDAVMQRACRTGAGADSFFMVQKLLCVEGTFVTQRTFMTDSPIKIDVFVAEGSTEAPDSDNGRPSAKKAPLAPHQKRGLHLGLGLGLGSGSGGIAISRASSVDPGEGGGHSQHSAAAGAGAGTENGLSTPPSTPPVARAHRTPGHHHQHHHHHHIGLPSPLKIGLRNMGLMSSGKGAKSSAQQQQLQPLDGGHSSHSTGSNSVGPPFTPPATPSASASATTPGASHSFSFSSASIDESAGKGRAVLNGHHLQNGTGGGGTGAGPGASSSICARIQVLNSFAIYDVAAIEQITGEAGQDPDPWLEVEAIVVDESNFKTDQHSRKLQLIVTCPATGKVYTSAPDPSTAARHSGRLLGRKVLQELTSWLSHLPHHHGHWRHHHDHRGAGQLHQSASDLSEQVTPPGSTRSTVAADTHSLMDPVESLLARGEAHPPPRPQLAPLSLLSGTETSKSDSVAHSSSDSAISPISNASTLPALAEVAEQAPSEEAAGDEDSADPESIPFQRFSVSAAAPDPSHARLHEAAVAALCASSPTSTDHPSRKTDVDSGPPSVGPSTATLASGEEEKPRPPPELSADQPTHLLPDSAAADG